MDKSTLMYIKQLLYNSNIKEVKKEICEIKDPEILYIYIYNYNWSNGFDIPLTIITNEKCDLSIALLTFYRADGLTFLLDKTENMDLGQWHSFVKTLYEWIIQGKYQNNETGFKIPLSKVQKFKLKKNLTKYEEIFITDIEGKILDIEL